MDYTSHPETRVMPYKWAKHHEDAARKFLEELGTLCDRYGIPVWAFTCFFQDSNVRFNCHSLAHDSPEEEHEALIDVFEAAAASMRDPDIPVITEYDEGGYKP